MSAYLQNFRQAVVSLTEGLKLTFRYLFEARTSRKPIGVEDETYFDTDKGIVTLQYPYESLPVPDNARYRLHNEIDDCIVCDKCAKVCPVDCIDIDPIRSPETFGVTSDGTPKRIYAAKFDIDMSKCCFCGLCTTVCPTECLTMTKVYDFSEFDVKDHVYSFAEMDLVEIAQKRKELADFEAKKEAERQQKATESPAAKPVIKPKAVKPAAAKPAMKPKVPGQAAAKPVIKPKVPGAGAAKPVIPKPAAPKPVIKKTETGSADGEKDEESKPKPKFRPRPMIPKKKKGGEDD